MQLIFKVIKYKNWHNLLFANCNFLNWELLTICNNYFCTNRKISFSWKFCKQKFLVLVKFPWTSMLCDLYSLEVTWKRYKIHLQTEQILNGFVFSNFYYYFLWNTTFLIQSCKNISIHNLSVSNNFRCFEIISINDNFFWPLKNCFFYPVTF